LNEDENLALAMARELVTEKGIGESADLVWRRLQRQQADVFGARAAHTLSSEIESQPSAVSVPKIIVPPVVPISAMGTQLVMFGMAHEALQRRKGPRRPSSARTVATQLGLFGN
jgi:hypothetical protein